jgi:hypothetical protein
MIVKRENDMQYLPYAPWRKYASPLFDPLSVTGAALAGLTGGGALSGSAFALGNIGSALSAANTIAGGNYAAEAGQMKQSLADFQAEQDVENSPGEIASAQRQAINVDQQANLQRSSAVANAAAGGIEAGTGSALTNQAQIMGRGNYQAGMDLWQGQNRATQLLNDAAGKQYSGYMDLLGGEEAQRAADLSAGSTIAGGGASLLRMYGGGMPLS